MIDKQLLDIAISASLDAGQVIMSIYGTDFDVDYKKDQSPLTLADQKANEVIEQYLKDTDMPVLSEESRQISYSERKGWHRFWLVDPLDGTKEFIKRNGEFTVNIALIDGHEPIMGVVYAPDLDILYFGAAGEGAYKLDCRGFSLGEDNKNPDTKLFDSDVLKKAAAPLPIESKSKPAEDKITLVGSRSHGGPDLEQYIEELKKKYQKVHFTAAGSSLKICLVAEGAADQYPRLGPTMEWDTGAGHAVASASGAVVLEFNTRQPLKYNKNDLLNPWFMVERLK